jgi:histidinol phosphatase-like enzyme
MLLEAARLLNLALDRSVLMGDKVTDMEAARTGGLAFGIHVLTGHGRAHEADSRALASIGFPLYVVERASEAIPLLDQPVAR